MASGRRANVSREEQSHGREVFRLTAALAVTIIKEAPMTCRTLSLAVVATAIAASVAFAEEHFTLSVAEAGEFGQYIVGPDGKPVYMFTTDTQGNGADPAITCSSEDCLAAWPLVTVEGDVMVGPGLDPDLAGTMARDGQAVVTYNGWPLYTFVRDQAGAAPEGQDIESFGGEWYLLGPDGEMIEEEPA